MTSESPPLPALPALAARAQLGDREALERLLRLLCPLLQTHIRILLKDDDAADDVLQDSLWLISRRLGTLHDVARVKAWAFRIASREATRALSRSHRRQTESLDEVELANVHTEVVDESFASHDHRLLEQLALMPTRAQVVVRLRFIEELSQQEIAEALEIPLGTVKSRLAYGLNWLRDRMQPNRE